MSTGIDNAHKVKKRRLPKIQNSEKTPEIQTIPSNHSCRHLFRRQPRFNLGPLRLSSHSNLIPRSIESHMHLVERILLTLLKLLLTSLNTLVPPQPGILFFDLRHPTRLERRIGSLVPSLRVAIDLGSILVGQRQCVQRIINTRGAQIAGPTTRRSIVVQL